MGADGLSQARKYKLFLQYKKLYHQKDWDTPYKPRDIVALRAWINKQNPWSSNTKKDYLRLIKQFTKWYVETQAKDRYKEFEDETSKITIGNQLKDIQPEELYNWEDIDNLRNAATNSRFRGCCIVFELCLDTRTSAYSRTVQRNRY